jgi:hypothetical protein
VQVTGEVEELENDIKKEANSNRSPMPWGPLDPPQILLIKRVLGKSCGSLLLIFNIEFSLVLTIINLSNLTLYYL